MKGKGGGMGILNFLPSSDLRGEKNSEGSSSSEFSENFLFWFGDGKGALIVSIWVIPPLLSAP